MVRHPLPGRLRVARIAHGWALLPLLFMLTSLPMPPAGADAVSFALLLACVIGSAAFLYTVTRRPAAARWLALLLGVYALFRLIVTIVQAAAAPAIGPAAAISIALVGSVWIAYVVAMLCCLPPAPVQFRSA